ncbi:MAG: SipW-dependent-type signal peptide-containing protein [Micrococcales bacterium]|nr:SipW-dependent-type signal peptide-containing protein [Micrococcales bacterium]
MTTDRNKRQRRVKGLIAGAAGAALLLAGGTWALWSDSDSVNGGIITAGNLELSAPSDAYFFDISTSGTIDPTTGVYTPRISAARGDQTHHPRWFLSQALLGGTAQLPCWTPYNSYFHDPTTENAHDIPFIADWHMVPGDRIVAIWPIEVALEGDNLVAELTLDGLPALNALPPYFTDPTFDVWVDGDQASAVNAAGQLVALLQADNEPNGTNDPGIPVVTNTTITGNANACVVLAVTFDGDTVKDRMHATRILGALQNVDITLKQTREPGIGHYFW